MIPDGWLLKELEKEQSTPHGTGQLPQPIRSHCAILLAKFDPNNALKPAALNLLRACITDGSGDESLRGLAADRLYDMAEISPQKRS